MEIESLQEALEEIHSDVKMNVSKRRERSRHFHNQKTNIKPINFRVRDFALIRRARG